ncbi:MAG: hypothetical protein IJN52_07485 [Bacteroidales bacterium]|nr:hypothetical protein [Bacteroidales bacterium]
MKAMNKLFVAAVIATSLTACQQESFEVRTDSDNYYASVETFATGTKTVLEENRSVVWSSEDRIAIFEGKDVGQAYQVLDSYVGKSSGEFAEVEGLVTEGTDAAIEGSIAVYPFNEALTVTSGDNGDYVIEGVTFPSEQKYVAGSFSDEAFPMVAVTSDKNLSFKNVGGVLKLSLTGSYSVSSITLTGNSGELLSGPATVTLGPDGIPSVTMSDDASTSVSLVCDPAVQLDSETATEFYISIPPTEFEAGFSVNITESEGGNAIKNTEKQNNVCRSQILVMPAFAPPTHMFKENYYEDYDAYISEEGITMLSKKTEDGYEILIGHYDETEESWNDDQFMVIHTDSLSRVSDLYIENELLRFSNYSDNAVDILHIVGEDYELYEHAEMPITKSVLFATKSEGVDADQGSETIEDLIKVIVGSKTSFEFAVNLIKHKGKTQTVLASINYISTAIPGLGGVALSEIQIGLEKKFLGRMPSLLEGELLLVEAVNGFVDKVSDRLIGSWKITDTNVIVYTAESAEVNYTISGIKSNPNINLSGNIGYRNVTNNKFTNISIPVINGTHKQLLTLSGPGDYTLTITLNGTGGFFKRLQIHFNVPDYPMCLTGSASNITTTSAVVDCTYSNIPEDGQCQVLLSWDDGHKIVKAENREGEHEISLTDLEPNTTYSYCACIDYEGGPVNGETKEFTTKEDDVKLRNMLISLYNQTDGDNWYCNENWCTDSPLDTWWGISYRGEQMHIDLSNNNLSGKISWSDRKCNTEFTIDVSDNPNLEDIAITHCFIKISLDASGCIALTDLCIEDVYHLIQLKASNCSSLEIFDCHDSYSSSVNLSGCTALEYIDCSDCQLSSLNLSGCTALEYIDCSYNDFTSLDLSECTSLKKFHGIFNPLSSLNLLGCTALESICCAHTNLTSLNLSGCTALEFIDCEYCNLTSLNLSDCIALKEIRCQYNHLTSLNISGCLNIHSLDCANNLFKRVITPEFQRIPSFTYDRRYTNYYHIWILGDEIECKFGYTENPVGWWYEGEPDSEHLKRHTR